MGFLAIICDSRSGFILYCNANIFTLWIFLVCCTESIILKQ